MISFTAPTSKYPRNDGSQQGVEIALYTSTRELQGRGFYEAIKYISYI